MEKCFISHRPREKKKKRNRKPLLGGRAGLRLPPWAANLLLGLLYAKEPAREKRRRKKASNWREGSSLHFAHSRSFGYDHVAKPHVNDCTKCHLNIYILIQKLGNFIHFLWFLGIIKLTSFTKSWKYRKISHVLFCTMLESLNFLSGLQRLHVGLMDSIWLVYDNVLVKN